ncbi:MAG: hypothetical protein JO147_12175 [Actinobacteria bacterium]|nr:hypothetical protein [Actinomycetota bacterium]
MTDPRPDHLITLIRHLSNLGEAAALSHLQNSPDDVALLNEHASRLDSNTLALLVAAENGAGPNEPIRPPVEAAVAASNHTGTATEFDDDDKENIPPAGHEH